MDMYQQQQKLMDDVCRDIQACIDLVGEKDPSREAAYGFIPGMSGMENQAKVMREHIQTLRQGIFQVLFTGGFSAGKSTLLNALMRKNVLRTSIKAETAVITKIVFHAEEKVIVYKKQLDAQGKPVIESYTVDSFFKKYRVDQDDPEKFKDIDYVQLQQDQDGIGGSLIQLVDSPGTSNSETDTEMARSFARQASAIVFLINATMPFTYEDKQYIKSHFANQGMRNLFFIINRFDSLSPDDQEDTKEEVRKQLQNVFTVNGQFDEKLFSSRVFYTNAYGSLYARMGRKTPYPQGEVDIRDENTGVPDFETALGRFLTDSDRDKDALAAYVPRLATIFSLTKRRVDEELRKYAEGLESIEGERQKLESNIERIEKILNGIEAACKTTAVDLITDIKRDYENYVNAVATGWDSHFSDPAVLREIKFGTTDLIAVATSRNEEKKRERLKPIQEAVAAYVVSKQPILNESINQSITAKLSGLSTTLEMYQDQLDSLDCPINVDEILTSVLKTAAPDAAVDPNMKINTFQVILGIAGADPEIALGGIAGGKSNMQAIVNAIALNTFEFIALYVVAWPVGIAMLGVRAWQMIRGWRNAGSDAAVRLISGLKTQVIEDLRAGKAHVAVDMEKKAGGGIIRAGSSLTQGFRTELDGERRSMADMIENLKSANFSLEDETRRTAGLLGEMARRISHINELTVGKPLSEQEILHKAESVPAG